MLKSSLTVAATSLLKSNSFIWKGIMIIVFLTLVRSRCMHPHCSPWECAAFHIRTWHLPCSGASVGYSTCTVLLNQLATFEKSCALAFISCQLLSNDAPWKYALKKDCLLEAFILGGAWSNAFWRDSFIGVLICVSFFPVTPFESREMQTLRNTHLHIHGSYWKLIS